MPKPDEDFAPSLDQLSQAFAEAMGKHAKQPAGEAPAASRTARGAGQEETARAIEADDACPISPETILEAILFVGHPDNEPVTAASVARLLRGVEEDEVDALVESLNEIYRTAGFPFAIDRVGAGYQLQLRQEFDHVRERFHGRIRQARLSQKAVDVLAVVAYNQPVTRREVDKILNTGQNSGRLLNQLVRRDLLARKVSSDGSPRNEFVTTDRFLAFFNLRDIGDLPQSDDPQ